MYILQPWLLLIDKFSQFHDFSNQLIKVRQGENETIVFQILIILFEKQYGIYPQDNGWSVERALCSYFTTPHNISLVIPSFSGALLIFISLRAFSISLTTIDGAPSNTCRNAVGVFCHSSWLGQPDAITSSYLRLSQEV